MHEVKTKQKAVAALESALIQHVRLGDGASRIELARAMNLAPSTVGLYVDRLIEEGYLLEGEKSRRGTGRPPQILELNPHAGQFVGVDFEARQLSATAVDFSQQTLYRQRDRIRSSDSADGVVEKIKRAIAAAAQGGKRLLGVGVAVPGTVDNARGIALHYEFIRGWRNIPLVEELSRDFEVPIYLENNIRAMALAERWFGLARDVDNFVCVGIRSGIGAGVVIDGELRRGTNNLAGEIGSWSSLAEDSSATTRWDTLEEQASVRAILKHVSDGVRAGQQTSLRVKNNGAIEQEDLLKAARSGDPLVLDVLERTGRILGRTIGQLNLLLNPEQVIIAGPLAELGNLFLDPIRQMVQRLTPPLHASLPHIVASQLGEYSGALGAAAMAVHQWKPAR